MENWKDIKGYEGLYQVSNIGRVKRLVGFKCNVERFLKGSKDKDGYIQIYLSKDGNAKMYKLHRLVAEAFVPNPDNKPEIDHINTIRTDNTVCLNEDGSVNYEKTNLRWTTRKENANNPITKKHHKRVCSEETKRKIGAANKGKQPRKGAVLTDETKNKISKSLKEYYGRTFITT